jgi:D-alanyl-D-alanine dipeptidase
MYSVMTLLPDRRSGFVVLMNGDGDEARTVLNEVLVKHFTAPGQTTTVDDYAARIAAEPAASHRAPPLDTSSRRPARPEELASRLGIWRDPWFGEARLCAHDGAVRFASAKSPELRGQVVRVGQRYLVDWDGDDLEAWLDFAGTGTASAMTLAKVDPAGDFSYDYEDLAFGRVGACGAGTPMSANALDLAGSDLVDIATLVPDIALEIRYAGSDNFVGTPIDGYLAPKCYLRSAAAQALQRIESALRRERLRLKLFDCYRPARAVRHFVRWAEDLADQSGKQRYYPNLDKRALLGDYIAPVSGHSRGATVDLTLLDCSGGEGRCKALDMGTGFDFFDARANTDAPGITPAQRANRRQLRTAMAAQGFVNYPLEWWHYTHAPPRAEEPVAPILDLAVE